MIFPVFWNITPEMSLCGKKSTVSGPPYIWKQCAFPDYTSAVGSYISRQYDCCGKHLIAAGNTVTDISRVYQSYASAVILLHNCFFFPEKTFLTENTIKQLSPKGPGSGFPAVSGKYFFQIPPCRRGNTLCSVS